MEKTQMRSKKETKKTSAKKVQVVENIQDDDKPTASIEDFNNAVDTSFFYINDKHLNAIDDAEVINGIVAQYPDFNQKNKDTQLKKIFLQVLENEEFIEDLLDYYSLTIFDFFKIIYKNYSSLFNTLFIKKVKDKIKTKKYARV